LTFIPILLQKVTVWFQNAHQRRQDRNPKTSKATGDSRAVMTWTAHKVIKEKISDELNALLLDMDPEAHPGSKGYLKHVHSCLTELIERLSEEKVKEFEEVAALRDSDGVNAGLKAKWVQLFFL
jgi:hypothetical protein